MNPTAPQLPQSSPSLGVSSCYVFKSRLQEYAQKVGFSTPVYETTKEGPSHEPLFKSTVIVERVRYDSLPGFSNRKAAEQSAAEVALLQLANWGDNRNTIRQPVHEIGLCKNLLQEYAQKMNYAIPLYECKKEDKAGRGHYSCVVDLGGIRYVGAVAKTKKEAEIKAARTALLAIQTSPSQIVEDPSEESQYTVVPCKRKEPVTPKPETVKTRKPKKNRFNKNPFNKKRRVGGEFGDNAIRAGRVDDVGTINVPSVDTNLGSEVTTVPSGKLCTDEILPHDGTLNMSQSCKDTSASEGADSTTVPSGNFAKDEITINMSQSHGVTSTSEGAEATTVPSGNSVKDEITINMIQSHGDASTSEGAEVTTVPSGSSAMDEIMPCDGTLNIRAMEAQHHQKAF